MTHDPDRDHWQQLAEQLGLPPEPEQKPVAQRRAEEPPREHRAPPPKPKEVNEVKDEQEQPRSWPASIPMHTFAKDEAPADDDADEGDPALSAAEDTLFSAPVGEGETDEGQPAPGGADAPGEGAPPAKKRRGRRRRGRGKGPRDAAAGERAPREPAGEGEAPAAEAETEDAEPRGPRGRRGGRRPAPVFDETHEPEDAVVPETHSDDVERAEDDDDEPMEDLNQDWSVPSWSELIASLYRPER